MDASRFDALARAVAARPTRRRLVRAVAGLGIVGLLGRVTARPTSAKVNTSCTKISCPGQCICCEFDQKGGCGCRCCVCTGGGIVGGGTVRTAGGDESTLVLLATRNADQTRQDVFSVEGHVRWVDPAWEGAGLNLESTVIAYYAPLAAVEGGREAAGSMRSAQIPGDLPFVIRATVTDPAGNSAATVALWVGDAVLDDAISGTFDPAPEPSGFRYAAEGTLISGDLVLVSQGSDIAPA